MPIETNTGNSMVGCDKSIKGVGRVRRASGENSAAPAAGYMPRDYTLKAFITRPLACLTRL